MPAAASSTVRPNPRWNGESSTRRRRSSRIAASDILRPSRARSFPWGRSRGFDGPRGPTPTIPGEPSPGPGVSRRGSNRGRVCMSRWLRAVAVPLVVFSIAAACSKSSTTSGAAGSGSPGCTSDLKVGLALDVGGLGDKGFNDLAYAGLNKAIADGIICKENTKYVEANSEGSNLRPGGPVADRRRVQPDHRHGLRVHGQRQDQRDRAELSRRQLRHHRRLRDVRHRLRAPERRGQDPERRGPDLQGAGRLLPGGRRRGARGEEAELQQRRLPGRPDRPADREVRGRVHRRASRRSTRT